MKYKIIFALIFIASYLYCGHKKKAALQKQLVADLGLQLRGVITDKYEREIEKGNGILQIKVTESNITHYDMRGKEPYLCYINGDTAFFYVNIREAKIGDTILVNTNSNFVYNTKGELSFIKQLIVWDPYWEKVKKSGY